MRKYYLMLLAGLALSACVKNGFDESSGEDRVITVSFSMSSPALRSGYDPQTGTFLWNDGDAVGVMNNVDKANALLPVSDTPEDLTFPGNVSRIYGVYPYSDKNTGGPSEVRVSLPVSYTQAAAGRFDAPSYPMYAAEPVKGTDEVTLSFSPLVTVLALNIYKSEADVDGELIRKVRVVPGANTGFVGEGKVDLTASSPAFKSGDSESAYAEVTLGTPCGMTIGAPAVTEEKRKFANQIYIPLARQNYSDVTFEITTNYGVYSIKSPDGALFMGSTSDIILTGINLTDRFVSVENTSFEDPEKVTDTVEKIDRIPDFSRVGYHYGESPLPVLPVAATISPETVAANLSANGGAYADTTSYIQGVIDQVGKNGGGAILLKNGTYNIGSTLFIDHSGIVLRGESEEGTVIKATGKQVRSVIFMGQTLSPGAGKLSVNGREIGYSDKQLQDPVTEEYFTSQILAPNTTAPIRGRSTEITEDYVPVGRLWVSVRDASLFTVGDLVEIYRPATLPWIEAIYMDRIADPDGGTVQWSERISNYDLKYIRRVTGIRGDKVYFDAPIVMAMDKQYGDCHVYRCTWSMIRESGVEYLTIDSEYDPSLVTAEPTRYHELIEPVDEQHAWYGVRIGASEHCWVRNVTARHMGVSAVCAQRGLNVTVQDCKSYDPVSYPTGGRRYAFYILGGQMILFKDCVCTHDRHSYVTSSTEGPNVFYNCRSEISYNDSGPHAGWSTGILYDNLWTDGWLYVRDRGKGGDGHGWAGAEHVFWNCTVANYRGVEGMGRLICQSPWASAKNYCVGCLGHEFSIHEERVYSGGSYEDGSGGNIYDWCRENIPGYDGRPHGEWYPYRPKNQNITGGTKVYLPDADAAAACSWWPLLTKDNYANSHSLYLSQLEDRLGRGVYLMSF